MIIGTVSSQSIVTMTLYYHLPHIYYIEEEDDFLSLLGCLYHPFRWFGILLSAMSVFHNIFHVEIYLWDRMISQVFPGPIHVGNKPYLFHVQI